ncbi:MULTISPECIES: ADP-ribosyltransferase [unclassified Actinomyces]|uniref:ADP-ribosyltransferase n=1 Tax=unclassified Actinomyces TaxID=2609248 RepID=UPI000D58E2FC|nr:MULTISPECIES: ADP-ribosyltransferase [unclassified Actinomyces]RAX24320.1 hypothetical protein DRB07_01005 [Actinomyces sp. Z3]
MTVANPLVAAQQESESSFWAGTGVGEDISDLSQAIGEGSWVQGSLAGVGLAGDVLFTVTNPIAAGVSIVVGWIIEHISPLDEMLEQLTGDADAVIAGSQTWTNIADAYTQQATSLNDYLTADMADQAGQTADAWRTRAGKLAGGMNAMSAAAANIAKGLEISAAIVQFVHDMVRDAISEAIGMFFEAAAEEIFSLGLATPVVAGQISTWVADKVSMLASKAKDLVNSFEALSELLKKIEPGVTKLMNGLKKLDLSDWAESKGTQVGRDIKNHMSGSTPKHHTTTLTAAHTSTSGGRGNSTSTTSSHSTTSTSSSHSTTSSAGGGHSTTSTSSSGGAGSPGSSSGGSGTSYHGIDPIHGDTTGTTPSSPAASTSSTPASASMADAAGGSHTRAGTTTPQADTPATTPAVPTTDASYHGIDPIHGDTAGAPSSAHNTTHADTTRADAGATGDTSRAGSSGPEGARTSSPEADTGRAEAGDPDSGSSRTNDTDTGRADSGNAPAEADGTHTGDGADADSSRPAQHDTEPAGRDAETTPARTDADQPDTTTRDGSSPETGQDTGHPERPDQPTPTGDSAGPHPSRTGSPDTDTPDASNPHSERAPESDRPDTQHANDTGDGKTGSDSDPGNTNPNDTGTDTDTHGRSDADADPGSNRPGDQDPQQHQPDEHPRDPESPDSERPKGQEPDPERPRDPESPDSERPKGQEPDPEHPKGQEPESVSARRDPEDNNSHSNAAAADTTTPHTKTDDTPDPTGNHKDTPDTDTTSSHSNDDGEASSHDAHDSEPPSDSDGHVHFDKKDVPTPPQETFDTPRYAYNDPEVARWADETSAATGLSRDGVIGTYDYTTNNGYSTMNPALRGSPDAPLTPEVQARIDNTLKGMDELPPVPGTTYRGTNLPDDVYHSLKDGAKEYVDQGFLSSSKEGNIADTFKDNSNNAVVFTIEGHSGVDVNPFSAHKGEAEILFRPGTTFKVTESSVGADGILYVKMTEV